MEIKCKREMCRCDTYMGKVSAIGAIVGGGGAAVPASLHT